MGFKITSRAPQLKAYIAEQAKAAVNAAIHEWHAGATEAVPQPGQSRGYATGALKASGYVLEAGVMDNSAYWLAVDAAKAAPDTLIVRRDQITPPLNLPPDVAGAASAVLHFPLTYALAIDKGFYHVRAKRHIVGVAFMESGESRAEAVFQRELRKLVTGADKVGLRRKAGGK